MIYISDTLQNYGSAELQRDLALLPQWRREQALSYRHFTGQRNCSLSYLLLCEGLRKEYGIMEQPEFVLNEHGKPSLGISGIHFNLSHTDYAVACLLSDRPCGVDVESRGRYKESLARYCMNDEEMARILGSEDPDLEFTCLWTQKEALVKRLGTGITDNIKDILAHAEGITTSVNEKYVISTAL